MKEMGLKIDAMIKERYRLMTPDERVRIAASLHATGCAIVLSSLPRDLSRRERRLAFARRMYAGELPEAALLAFADWCGHFARDQLEKQPAVTWVAAAPSHIP